MRNPRSIPLRHLLLAALAAGCLMSDEPAAAPTLPPPTRPVDVPAAATVTPIPPDPNVPAILLETATASGPLYLIRYPSAGQTCLSATFNPRIFEHQQCGPFEGVGVGFVTTISDPGGGEVRVAYGLALEATITAIALEFTGGGNTNMFVQNGGYVFVLADRQTPRRAVAIDQFGNLVGTWAFGP